MKFYVIFSLYIRTSEPSREVKVPESNPLGAGAPKPTVVKPEQSPASSRKAISFKDFMNKRRREAESPSTPNESLSSPTPVNNESNQDVIIHSGTSDVSAHTEPVGNLSVIKIEPPSVGYEQDNVEVEADGAIIEISHQDHQTVAVLPVDADFQIKVEPPAVETSPARPLWSPESSSIVPDILNNCLEYGTETEWEVEDVTEENLELLNSGRNRNMFLQNCENIRIQDDKSRENVIIQINLNNN